MNDSEKCIFNYLKSRGYINIVHEPDGKIPPDFLIDGRIAVEVRRLNQNEKTSTGHRGLEEVSKPLATLVEKGLDAIGPPINGVSWFVDYTYRRPLPNWRKLEELLRNALREIMYRPNLENEKVRISKNIRLNFTRASNVHSNLFLLGGYSDHDSGGFLVAELAHNLQICIEEKSRKVSKVRSKYSEWWLALEDRISYGDLDEHDRNSLRKLVEDHSPWNKIILVNPLKPSSGFEL